MYFVFLIYETKTVQVRKCIIILYVVEACLTVIIAGNRVTFFPRVKEGERVSICIRLISI